MKLLIVTQKVNEKDQVLGFFIKWLQLLSKHFSKVTVICLEKGKYDLPENVEVISLGKERGASKFKQLPTFYFLIYTLRNDYDAVFIHMNPIWMVLGGLCWKMMGKRTFLWYTSGGVTLKLKIAEKFADKIFTASPESFRLQSGKVIVTGHGIDTELFKPEFSKSNLKEGISKFDLRGIKILSVGRIAPVKNYEILVDAAKILSGENFNFSVTIVGEPILDKDKEYEENLKFKIENLKLADCFNFVGKVSQADLPEYYRSHDLFIHLSKTGSLDKTILEAMACGINVISSNDASRSFLPADAFLKEDRAEDLAVKIKSSVNKNYGPDLRRYVVENHNFNNLIKKISDQIHEK